MREARDTRRENLNAGANENAKLARQTDLQDNLLAKLAKRKKHNAFVKVAPVALPPGKPVATTARRLPHNPPQPAPGKPKPRLLDTPQGVATQPLERMTPNSPWDTYKGTRYSGAKPTPKEKPVYPAKVWTQPELLAQMVQRAKDIAQPYGFKPKGLQVVEKLFRKFEAAPHNARLPSARVLIQWQDEVFPSLVRRYASKPCLRYLAKHNRQTLPLGVSFAPLAPPPQVGGVSQHTQTNGLPPVATPPPAEMQDATPAPLATVKATPEVDPLPPFLKRGKRNLQRAVNRWGKFWTR